MGDLFPSSFRKGGLSPIDFSGRLLHSFSRKYDLIHGFDHRPVVSLPAMVGQFRHGVPYVADWADLWGYEGIAGQRKFLYRILLGASDHYWELVTRKKAGYVTSISRELTYRSRQLGIPENHIQEISVGANIDDIQPLPKLVMRHKYGLPADALIFVNSGFVSHDALLLGQTFVILARNNPRVILLLTGSETPEVRQLVHAAGVADQVRFLGIVPHENLGEVLACGDVMLLPYSNNPVNIARFPNRSGDYMAAGRPIATNLTGDLGQLVSKYKIGIAAPDEPEPFATAIQSLLNKPLLMAEMGAHARWLAETRFSWLALAKKLDQFYQFVVSDYVAA